MGAFRNLLMSSSAPKYTPLEYIQSSGTQYIDSEYYINDNTVMYIDFVPLQSDKGFELGARTSNTVNEFTLFASYSQVFYANYGSGSYFTSTAIPLNQRYQIKMGKWVGVRLSQDDFQTYTQKIAPFTNRTLTSAYPCGILAGREGANWGGITVTRLYGVKVYENDVLIRDYKPALDGNGVACLYDPYTDKFYYNAGTGTFTYGTL